MHLILPHIHIFQEVPKVAQFLLPCQFYFPVTQFAIENHHSQPASSLHSTVGNDRIDCSVKSREKELCNLWCIERCRCFFTLKEEHTEHGNSSDRWKMDAFSFIVRTGIQAGNMALDNRWNDDTWNM